MELNTKDQFATAFPSKISKLTQTNKVPKKSLSLFMDYEVLFSKTNTLCLDTPIYCLAVLMKEYFSNSLTNTLKISQQLIDLLEVVKKHMQYLGKGVNSLMMPSVPRVMP